MQASSLLKVEEHTTCVEQKAFHGSFFSQKLIQFADDLNILSVVERKVAYLEKSRKFYKTKTEEYVEMNKQTLNTNKTELIFFSRINSDCGSVF